jgi:hypothetical protein
VKYTQIHFESQLRALRFQTGVSIHGHTLHSKESLDFIYRLARGIAPVRWLLKRGEARYRRANGAPLDLSRAWWTPPLSAHQAWMLEARRIENQLGLRAFVSLSDHDDIEAPVNLQLLEECRPVPVSVEWTVPYGGTFFHIGVHNLPSGSARQVMAELAAFTSGQKGARLQELFEALASNPQILIVFNHANWDEKGIGEAAHRATVRQFARTYKAYLHAFELNGLRPWAENRAVFDLARAFGKPLISGGDRHAGEPSTLLNLTNASTFSGFVQEIRDGVSDVLITNQYLEPFSARILQNLEDILGRREDHAYGWKNWSDRVFYVCDDGVARPWSQVWGDEPVVKLFAKGIDILRHPHFKQAFRVAFARREEVVF